MAQKDPVADHKSIAICRVDTMASKGLEADASLGSDAAASQSSTPTAVKSLWSVEEALTARVNGWSGWLCAAGTENLHITPDGNLFSATCRVGGFLGNVFEGKMSLPKEWITCTKQWCMCGADMQIRKTRNATFQMKTHEELPVATDSSVGTKGDADWVSPAQFEAHRAFPKSITWDISRRCNFSCSYCHPSVSNQHESHHSLGSLNEAVDRINDRFCKGVKTKWVFTGGEPTINPAFMEVVRKINSFGHMIHVQSNGSRGPEYFRELIAETCVGLSCHLEELNIDRFVETCRAVVEEKKLNERAGRMWFGVRIMVAPGMLEKAKDVRSKLLAVEGFERQGFVNLSPLYKRMKQDELMEYESTELAEIFRFA